MDRNRYYGHNHETDDDGDRDDENFGGETEH